MGAMIKRKLYGLLRYIASVLPVGNVILFESLNDYDGNSGAVYQYLVQNGYHKKFRMVWAARDLSRIPDDGCCDKIVCLGKSIKNLYYENRAKIVFFDNRMPVSRKRKNAMYIYLTHGCPHLKNIKGIINLEDICDRCLCPSSALSDFVSEQYGIDKSKLFFAGLPRNDILFRNVESVFLNLSDRTYDKIILWMPTFRKFKYEVNGMERNDSSATYYLGLPTINDVAQLDKIEETLKQNNCCLIIKFHPGAKDEATEHLRYDNIIFLKASELDNDKVYSLFKETDALISDYSSVVFDYMLLNKPIGYIIEDMNSYKLGFAFEDILENMPGHHIDDFDGLLQFIEDIAYEQDPYCERRIRICDEYQQFKDANNAKRIVEEFVKV